MILVLYLGCLSSFHPLCIGFTSYGRQYHETFRAIWVALKKGACVLLLAGQFQFLLAAPLPSNNRKVIEVASQTLPCHRYEYYHLQP